MKKLKYWIQDYFGFSYQETKGFVIVMLLILLLVFIPQLLKFWLNPSSTQVSDEQKLDSLIAELENSITKDSIQTISQTQSLFAFNPNTVDLNGLLTLGLEKKIAINIIKYRNKGGQFRIKSDLKKIYGISAHQYNILAPYIELPEEKAIHFKHAAFKTFKRAYPNTIAKREVIFNINTADTTQLIRLRGVGSKLAQRIINYRDKLGGFVSKEQFKEIYGLDTFVVSTLENESLISSDFIPKKLNLNTATQEQLKAHPYIKYKLAKLIVTYREQHGRFKEIEGLKKIKIVSEEDFAKMLPYLEI